MFITMNHWEVEKFRCMVFPEAEARRHTSFYCTLQVLHFLQIEDKTLHQQKITTHFMVVVWTLTFNTSEVCL